MHLVLETQRQQEPAAWITCRDSTFFPPDAADSGIDLSALAVIRAPNAMATARAAEHLLRSSAFGLLVLDFGTESRLPLVVQTRLAGQARHHETAVVCLTEKSANQPSIGSLVSLRAHAHRICRQDRQFHCQASVVKDKRQGPGWSHVEVYRGPDGLR
jgi:recombination protein RecA